MPRLKSLPFLHPREIQNHPTTSPYTQSFRHLLPVPKRQIKGKFNPFSRLKAVRVQDRIKWWNVVPGDLVRVVGKASGVGRDGGEEVGKEMVRTVTKVHKLSNRVYLKTDRKVSRTNPDKMTHTDQNVHYSDVRLFIGHHEFPPAKGSDKVRSLPVFALRLGTTQPQWIGRRWYWERFAIATTPKLPNWKPGLMVRIPIPWPRFEKVEPPEPTTYDTTLETVSSITYTPSPIPLTPHSSSVLRTQEDMYLLMLRNEVPYDQSIPMELILARELSNPHARAKKHARYLASQSRLASQKSTFISESVHHLTTTSRVSRTEAMKEAKFRWDEKVKADRKAELKKRWEVRGEKARLERRKERQRKKSERETRRLRELVLTEAPNQVVPAAQGLRA